MNKKFSLMMALILTALVAKAQDTPPDANWESDPLDVLESQQKDTVEPAVPEFQEIPEDGAAIPAPPAPEVAAPENSFEEVSPGTPAEVVPPPTQTVESAPAFAPGAVGSEPDYSKEAEFHRIYKNYNEQPTSVELWEKAVGARESEIYRVQKGDTLSGISTTFFGDPGFWPKIWSLNNGAITNPHEIDPMMNIQFFPGTADEAPTLDLAAAGTVEKEATVPATTTDVGTTAGVSIPRSKKRTPVLKALPNSLPSYRLGVQKDAKVEFQVELPKNQFPTAPEYLEYYMTDTPVQGVGRVTATEMDMKTAGEYQFIYVQLDDASSKEFVAQKNLTKVADPLVKNREGQMVELQGQIEVLEKVNDQQNIYRAIVKKSLQPVEVGALLMPGRLPMIDPSPSSDLTSGVGARIIGGQFDRKRNIFGNSTLIFLDGGSGQGLQEGQSLPIFADERVRNKKSAALMNDRLIGTVKIVRVSANFATGYVVKASDNVVVGDYVGKPVTQAMNAAPVVEAPAKVDSDFEKEFDEMPADTPGGSSAPDTGSDDSELDF